MILLKRRGVSINILNLIKGNCAFTLVEVLVAITILSLIIIPFTSLFVSSLNYNNHIENKMKAYSTANYYMERIKGEQVKINRNAVALLGNTIPVDEDIWTYVGEDDIKNKVFVKVQKNNTTISDKILNLKITVKVTDRQEKDILMELMSDIIDMDL